MRRLLAVRLEAQWRLGCKLGYGQLQPMGVRSYEQMRSPRKGCRGRRGPRNEPWKSTVSCLRKGQVAEEKKPERQEESQTRPRAEGAVTVVSGALGSGGRCTAGCRCFLSSYAQCISGRRVRGNFPAPTSPPVTLQARGFGIMARRGFRFLPS